MSYTTEEVQKRLSYCSIPEFTITTLGEFCSLIDNISYIWRNKVAERQTRKDEPAPFYYGELSP